MGNKSHEQNTKLYRWFEYKSYNMNNSKSNNHPNSLQNKGYLVPLSLERCANLEKQLNLNNEGLSTKYFFKYDYNDKLLTVKKNEHFVKRLKSPVISNNYIYKIKRYKRFSKNCFRVLKSNFSNYLNDLRVFYYSDIFNEFALDTEDKSVLKFTNHVTVMHKNLIAILQEHLILHLKNFHGLGQKDENIFNFGKLKQILTKDFKHYKNKILSMYPGYFLKDISKENFKFNIMKMMTEEGELFYLINDIYSKSMTKDINEDDVYLLFYLLCFQYSFDIKCNNKEILTCYKTIDDKIKVENLKKGNFLINSEFMSVSRDKNIFNINSNEDNDESPKQTIIEIEFEKPTFLNWYLTFKALDTENFSQYPIEHEILVQPNTLFEIMDTKVLPNNNLYIKLYRRANSFSDSSEIISVPKSMKINLGIYNDIGNDIKEKYPDLNPENVVSLTINSIDELMGNKENIGEMTNLRVLVAKDIGLCDNHVEELVPSLKNLNFLNYINVSLNNLTYKTLEYLEKITSTFIFLEHIFLDQNSFGDEGIIALCRGLGNIDNLKTVSVFSNHIHTEGIDKLSNEIKHYRNLYQLNLSTNYIFYEEIDELVSSIKFMNNLIELNLSNNQISSEGLCYIGEILPKTIQKLNFSENEIYQEGFSEFGTYLYKIPNLMSLIIYGNWVGPSGLNSLLDGFEFCPNLNYLDIGFTRIEDCDLLIFYKKLRKIKQIKQINFKENKLTDGCILFLAQCIDLLTNLEMIDISWNPIEGTYFVELFGILSKLDNLRCINISGTLYSNDVNDGKLAQNLENVETLLKILNQKFNTTVNNDDFWKYEKGVFKRKEKLMSKELFVKKYLIDNEI